VILAIVVIAVAGCAPATPEAGESGQENREGALARLLGPETLDITVVEGTPITVRLTTRVSSQSSAVGDTVEGVVAEGVFVDGRLVIPEGSILTGKVTTAEPLGKIGGRASLAFAFTRLTMPDGQQQPIDAGFARVGPSETARDATAIAVGSVVGVVLGHQVRGDSRGRAIGGLAGAGIGTAIAANTPGQPVELPASATLRLTLGAPVVVTVEVSSRRGTTVGRLMLNEEEA
jgi:hypothetical protein